MRLFLRGCEVVAFDESAAHRAGELLGKSRTKDVVDAAVAVLAIERHADIVSDDAQDIRKQLVAARAGSGLIGV
jgi:predicted nucleic acid-binding protein